MLVPSCSAFLCNHSSLSKFSLVPSQSKPEIRIDRLERFIVSTHVWQAADKVESKCLLTIVRDETKRKNGSSMPTAGSYVLRCAEPKIIQRSSSPCILQLTNWFRQNPTAEQSAESLLNLAVDAKCTAEIGVLRPPTEFNKHLNELKAKFMANGFDPSHEPYVEKQFALWCHGLRLIVSLGLLVAYGEMATHVYYLSSTGSENLRYKISLSLVNLWFSVVGSCLLSSHGTNRLSTLGVDGSVTRYHI